MTTCECSYLPEKYHTTHYGATDPATIQEYNPWCTEHGHLKEAPAPATTTTTETDKESAMTTNYENSPGAGTPGESSGLVERAHAWRSKAEKAAEKASRNSSLAGSASLEATKKSGAVVEMLKALP